MASAVTITADRSLIERLGSELRIWIARGATQSADGAFHGWRSAAEGLSPAYPEITGLALTHLAAGEEARGEVATRAAGWLCARIEAEDYRARATDGESIYLFDLGMIATGLARRGRAASDTRSAAAAARILERLASWLEPDRLRAIASASPLPGRGPTWSTHGTVHLLKLTQCLLLGAEAGDTRAGALATPLVEAGGASLQPFLEGDLAPYAFGDRLSLHALCYAAEGLWIWSEARGDPRARDGSRRVVEMLWRWQLPGGGFPGFVDLRGRAVAPEQGDVLAQMLRLAALHGLAETGIGVGVARLDAFALDDLPGRAIRYRMAAGERHCNTWATLFAIQALDALMSPQSIDWHTFV